MYCHLLGLYLPQEKLLLRIPGSTQSNDTSGILSGLTVGNETSVTFSGSTMSHDASGILSTPTKKTVAIPGSTVSNGTSGAFSGSTGNNDISGTLSASPTRETAAVSGSIVSNGTSETLYTPSASVNQPSLSLHWSQCHISFHVLLLLLQLHQD